ncbi:MAG: flagellar protein FlaG [Deltaproteobacteria bacterium]|nr:flagellar protein FlaG [Deltaproteobacteria bacterium]
MGIESVMNAAVRKPFEADSVAKTPVKGSKEAAPASEKAEAKPPATSDVEAIASEVQIYLKRLNTELRFEVDSRSKEVIVKIVDPSNDEVIRQIPSEELVAIRRRMEDLVGVLYKAST